MSLYNIYYHRKNVSLVGAGFVACACGKYRLRGDAYSGSTGREPRTLHVFERANGQTNDQRAGIVQTLEALSGAYPDRTHALQ